MPRTQIAFLTTLVLAGTIFWLVGCGDDPAEPGGGTEACSIAITSPSIGEEFLTGDLVNIRWDAAGGGDVRIALLKGGVEQGVIVETTPNDGFRAWSASTLGGASGADFAIEVTSTSDAACTDVLSPVTITNTVGCAMSTTFLPVKPAEPDTLTPTSTDTLYEGDDYTFTWDSENTSGWVDLELWEDSVDDVLVDQIVVGTADDGEYLWENIDSFHRGTSDYYFLRIADSTVDGCEARSRTFRLVDETVCSILVMGILEDSTWDEGASMTIDFFGSHSSDAMNLRLYEGYSNPLDFIAVNVPRLDTEFTWTVALPFGYEGTLNSFRILVVDAADQNCRQFSERFTINEAP